MLLGVYALTSSFSGSAVWGCWFRAFWRFREFRAQWAAFWPDMNMAPKVGPMRGAPSNSATCIHDNGMMRWFAQNASCKIGIDMVRRCAGTAICICNTTHHRHTLSFLKTWLPETDAAVASMIQTHSVASAGCRPKRMCCHIRSKLYCNWPTLSDCKCVNVSEQ